MPQKRCSFEGQGKNPKALLLCWGLFLGFLGLGALQSPSAKANPWPEKESITQKVIKANKFDAERAKRFEEALNRSSFATQGVPGATKHPVSTEACMAGPLAKGAILGGEKDLESCPFPWMAKIPGSSTCIDRFEFPNLPCEYPVTWVKAGEAAEICESMGKRLCEAAEWESACAGSFAADKPGVDPKSQNASREMVYAYGGSQRKPELCAFGSGKSPGCDAAISKNKDIAASCGTNTWPAGHMSQCAGPLGVYDLHGNAAEHMSLPKSGSKKGAGVTEMKGSWFVFSASSNERQPHLDDCRWRAPAWHRTDVADGRSHSNYHLGFRCCAAAK